MKVLAENRRARYDYEILEKFEAGVVLAGYEVKSIKLGRVSLGGSYVVFKDEEPFLLNANIPPYQPKNTPKDYDPTRLRKLLLNKDEIKYLIGKSQQKGLTLVPLRMYTKGGKIKLEVGVARGMKKASKKEILKKRDIDREIDRELKARG
ncbi:MAG: SsrA-binding protein SmpB [Candidatus Paceibacterota bacterium]|jgi:SsrA-binding protein|nr:SsrA-binding protein SmpB [Candidatus Paceibacterota bacterium]